MNDDYLKNVLNAANAVATNDVTITTNAIPYVGDIAGPYTGDYVIQGATTNAGDNVVITTTTTDNANSVTVTNYYDYILQTFGEDFANCEKVLKDADSETIKAVKESLESNGIYIDHSTTPDQSRGWICVEGCFPLSPYDIFGKTIGALFKDIRNPYFFMKFDKEVWFGEINLFMMKPEAMDNVFVLVSPSSPDYYKKDGRILKELTEVISEVMKQLS